MSHQDQSTISDDKKSIVLGKITSLYGVKGWVKVYSYTNPIENILQYKTWTLSNGLKKQQVAIKAGKVHGKTIVVNIDGCNDRDMAQQYCGNMVSVELSELPELTEGEFYWHQLEGLRVITVDGLLLGRISHLMETGSNDVIVVKACASSMDKRERLIPYLPEQVVQSVNLESGEMVVDWDPEF